VFEEAYLWSPRRRRERRSDRLRHALCFGLPGTCAPISSSVRSLLAALP